MNRFEIIIVEPDQHSERIFFEECMTFAEAATWAYMARSRLGLDWKIISVRQIGKKKDNE